MAASLPVLLDVSRTISRAGRRHDTGIDRVEQAYVRWALARPGTAFVCRMGRKMALVPADAAAELFAQLPDVEGARHWPLGRLMPGRSARDRRAERLVSVQARAVAMPQGLSPALRRHFGGDFAYINVGHTHLEERRLTALGEAGAVRRVVMIHDVIPLTHPRTQTQKSVTTFGRRLKAAALGATDLVTTAQATAQSISAHLPKAAPPLEVIPLGIEPIPASVEAHTQNRPYFVQLGTVEPRKNTELLLEVWPQLPEPRPELQLIGARGWLADRLFDKIEAQSGDVTHLEGLTDTQTRARLKGARALLFPSLAEGFGLPLFEAIAVNTPVIASDLPVFRELAPVGPLYLSSRDASSWIKEIKKQADRGTTGRAVADSPTTSIPSWDDHFDRLEAILSFQ